MNQKNINSQTVTEVIYCHSEGLLRTIADELLILCYIVWPLFNSHLRRVHGIACKKYQRKTVFSILLSCNLMSGIFMSCYFMLCVFISCKFMSWNFDGPSFSCPSFLANPWSCLRYPIFSRFDTIPACHGRADRRTDGSTDTEPYRAITARVVKTWQ